MYKKIPGNDKYLINLKEEIIDIYGNPVEILEKDGAIEIDVFGVSKKVMKKFIKLLAWYEVSDIRNIESNLEKILICPCTDKTLKIQCQHLLTFTEPIVFNEEFRYIPNYSRYAINLKGKVLDTQKNLIVKDLMVDSDGYPSVYIHNPDKGGKRWTRIHRLMAFAWLPNNDFITRPFVNHIDGDKTNYELENIEWCSCSENVRHALITGLTDTMIGMKSRDRFSGEIALYNSAAEMRIKLGMSGVAASSWQTKLPGYLYKGRYEIKRSDDDSPWYYEENQVEPGKAIYSITVLDKKTGEVKRFIKVPAFIETYGLRKRTARLDEIVKEFMAKYPNHEINYQKNSIEGPYKVMNINTGEVKIFKAMHEAGQFIGLTRTEIQYDLSREFKFIYSGGWIVVPKSGEDDFKLDDYKEKLKSVSAIEIVSEKDNSKVIASSIRHATKLCGVDPKTITKHIDTGNLIKGFRFRALA